MSLSRDADPVKSADNGNPLGLRWSPPPQDPDLFAMETLTISFHGAAYTHMDALSHMYYKGKTYNGVAKDRVVSKAGAEELTRSPRSSAASSGAASCMDIPRLKGVPYLEPRTAIMPADLDAWEKQAGIKVGSGDIVFFRTGRWARRAKVGPWDIGIESAGLHPSVAQLAEGARRRHRRLGRPRRGVPVTRQGRRLPHAPAPADRDGHAAFDNCDLEAVVRGCRLAQALDLPAHRVPARRPPRHRLAPEPDRSFLSCSDTLRAR